MRKNFLIFLVMCLAFKIESQTIDSTNLPLIVIDTQGQIIQNDEKIAASMKIISNGSGKMNHPGDPGNDYSGNIGIEIRGKYSASLPQKPYGIETRDQLGNNLNVSLLGMPKENDWILLANYNDKSFVRNSLAFKIFRDMGHWAPRTILCELVVNGTYLGIYNLTEKIKTDKNRVDIDKITNIENTGDEVTGGYVFSIDYYSSTDSWTGSYAPLNYPNKTIHFVYNFPKPDEITTQQKTYIQEYVKGFEKNLYSTDFNNPVSGYRSYINVQSFIDYFIVNELSRNVDGYKKSCFYNKSRNSKGGLLTAGPVWDFDWAWKDIWDCSIFQATDGSGWAYKVLECNPSPTPTGWIPRLMQDPKFVEELKNRYTFLRKNILSNSNLMSYIDSVNTLIAKAQVRHFQKWPILGQNVGAPEVGNIPTTYDGEVTKFKSWITTRLLWLDAQMLITNIPVLNALDNQLVFCKLYPNPANDILSIVANKKFNSFAIYDLTGKEIYKKDEIKLSEYQINVKTLNPGYYSIKLFMSNGITITNKFIVY